MPLLKNQRHELFAQAIVQGKKAHDAYEESYPDAAPATCDVNGSKLLKHTKISSRIAELRLRHDVSTKTVLTKAWVIEQTIGLAKEAREAGAYGPAAKCMELLGREVYAFVERSEIGEPGDFEALTDGELRKRIARELGLGRKDGGGTVEAEGSPSLQ
ncbi:MAG TPA: hypothetical protein VGG45_16280 [Terracidiphilus sp.]|jgi:hypothetical protein